VLDALISDMKIEINNYDKKISEQMILVRAVESTIESKTIILKEKQNELDDLAGNFTFSPFTGNHRAKDALKELDDAKSLLDDLNQEKLNIENNLSTDHTLNWETYYRSQYPDVSDETITMYVEGHELDYRNNSEWNIIEDKIFDVKIDIQTKENTYNSAVESASLDVIPEDPNTATYWEELKNKVSELENDLAQEHARLITTLDIIVNSDTGYNKLKADKQKNLENLELELEDKREKIKILEDEYTSAKNKYTNLKENIDLNPSNSQLSYKKTIFSLYQQVTLDDYAVGKIIKNADDTYEISPDSDQAWKDKLNELMDDDPEEKIIDQIEVDAADLDELTKDESSYLLSELFSSYGLDPTNIDPKMLEFVNNKLGGYFFIPQWNNRGPELPAPRFCVVEAVDGVGAPSASGNIDDKNKTPSRYPDWNSYTLEDLIPQFRDVLNFINEWTIKALKSIVDGTMQAILNIVKFIKERVIPKLEAFIKQLQDWVDLLKIGIIDAGIYFLYIPPARGGVEGFRQKLVSAGNRPSNLHFTYSFVMLAGGTDSVKSLEILDKLIDMG
jgi:hypothetical protein